MDMRELADFIQGDPNRPEDPVRMRKGVIQSIQSPKVTIRLGGSTTDIPEVGKLAHYVPTVGHIVLVLQQGPALVVVDRIG